MPSLAPDPVAKCLRLAPTPLFRPGAPGHEQLVCESAGGTPASGVGTDATGN